MSTGSKGEPGAGGDAPLLEALAVSQRLGMLGIASLTEFIDHSDMFVHALEGVHGLVVDLGSGGGVPGLVIAWRRRDLDVVLVDRRTTRADHLRRMTWRLGLEARVRVLAVDAATLPELLDGRAAAVVARSFGPPSAVVAAAVPILADGGLLVVSEPPPPTDDRWSVELLSAGDLRRLPTADVSRRGTVVNLAVLRHAPRGTSVAHGPTATGAGDPGADATSTGAMFPVEHGERSPNVDTC